MRRFKIFSAILIGLFLPVCFAPLLHASEPVEVIVEGVEGDALQNVQEALALPAGLVREGTVDKLWLERFVRQADDKIRAALEPFGYYNAHVSSALETAKDGVNLLRIKVMPGEPVTVSEVTVALRGPGDSEKKLQEQLAAFPLKKGDVLLQQNYEIAKGSLISWAQQLGYLDAEFSRHEIRITREATSARIELVLETGNRYRFNGARIKGAPDYPDAFLRRYLSFKSGDVFSYAKLGETQLNFSNSERFKEVVVTPEKEAAEEFKVPVLVQLKPGPRRVLRPGVGYGTDTGARFSIRYRDLNMFHLGHEFSNNLIVSERLQALTTGYIVPNDRDIRDSTSLQLALQRQDVSAYLSQMLSLELDQNRSFGQGKLGTAYLRLQLEDYTVGQQTDSSRLMLPGLRYSDDRYDSPIRPSRGMRYAVELRGTHQILGSDTGLLQAIAEGSHLQPLPWRLSLHTRAKAGITLLSDPLRDLPPTLRFFAGGDQSVRGYSYLSLGPRDAAGKVTGGRHLLTGSVELERALFKNWGISAFYDVGNAFNSFTSVQLFQGAGLGLHYYTPIGALNLSLARQIGVEKPGFHVHFTVGFEL